MIANNLQNRLPTKIQNKTLSELRNGLKTDLCNMRIFGLKALKYIHKRKEVNQMRKLLKKL